MDPVSLAFGVVALGLQLAETAAAVRSKISAYKSATRELSRLSDKLDNIEAICRSLEVAFDCYENVTKPWDAVLLKKLHCIMSDCRDRVSTLHEVITKISTAQKRRYTPLNTVGALFLKHKGVIRKCNDDLDESLQSLHLHMTTNILDAILSGLDVHCKVWTGQYPRFKGASALKSIMRCAKSPNDVLEMVQNWVELLEESGVNIQQYLEIEVEHCGSTWSEDAEVIRGSPFRRRFDVREIDGRQLPCWIELCDESCPSHELFEEFPHLTRPDPGETVHFPGPGNQEPHKAWKHVNTPDEILIRLALQRKLARCLPAADLWDETDYIKWRQMCIDGLERACDLMESRFERRQLKKLRKAGHPGKIKMRSQMPGAWVNEY
ncbi:hypothetical protein G7Z17_g9486 [Cylindrodendrum hubeiense]|uniref:Fungal N-terminal domain-containing protein n=1 Tax=Cylindrodendrum hubeiense TaxID=595255 RepID=A0A9P5H7S1_9HYPO|nr:hypothetical protein G7Z17_g9486 [Cylindrodendrum hubeiense]